MYPIILNLQVPDFAILHGKHIQVIIIDSSSTHLLFLVGGFQQQVQLIYNKGLCVVIVSVCFFLPLQQATIKFSRSRWVVGYRFSSGSSITKLVLCVSSRRPIRNSLALQECTAPLCAHTSAWLSSQ